MPCLLLIIMIRFTCGERKISWNIKKSQNIMAKIVVWSVGHMDPNIKEWATKPIHVPWNGKLPTWMWRQDHSQYS